MDKQQERRKAIAAAVADIREIADDGDITPDILARVRTRLLSLAAKHDLFTLEDFPPPEANNKRRSCLYRLSEDDDHRFALYANSADGNVNAPPHDHTTWAVIVGVRGQEENRFYDKAANGVEQTASHMVEDGAGVALMPDDIHSIHIKEGAPVLNFHMYGLGLEQLDRRNFWNERKEIWEVFPAHTDIREARH
ncbi:MAG: cysteine dioxygenase [Sneathiella sp.]|nr:MAG: cysteine dioxygenase [Sneathiella sp.]